MASACSCERVRSAEYGAERVEAFRHGRVPDPQPALLTGDEAGVDEDLHVMTDGRLRAAGRLDEIARADLIVGGGDERQEAKPDRIGEGGERLRQQFGLVLVEAVGANRGAAGNRIQHGDATSGHARNYIEYHPKNPLTNVEVSGKLNTSTIVNI